MQQRLTTGPGHTSLLEKTKKKTSRQTIKIKTKNPKRRTTTKQTKNPAFRVKNQVQKPRARDFRAAASSSGRRRSAAAKRKAGCPSAGCGTVRWATATVPRPRLTNRTPRARRRGRRCVATPSPTAPSTIN